MLTASIDIASPPAKREDTPLKFGFLVDDLIAAMHRARQAGSHVEPIESAWRWRGMRHLDGHDPEGNVFQFREPGGA